MDQGRRLFAFNRPLGSAQLRAVLVAITVLWPAIEGCRSAGRERQVASLAETGSSSPAGEKLLMDEASDMAREDQRRAGEALESSSASGDGNPTYRDRPMRPPARR